MVNSTFNLKETQVGMHPYVTLPISTPRPDTIIRFAKRNDNCLILESWLTVKHWHWHWVGVGWGRSLARKIEQGGMYSIEKCRIFEGIPDNWPSCILSSWYDLTRYYTMSPFAVPETKDDEYSNACLHETTLQGLISVLPPLVAGGWFAGGRL